MSVKVKNLVQETCSSRLVQETLLFVVLSCTSFFLYKNLASNRTQLCSMQETCRHVTKIERCDWSACLLTVDDLLSCCLHCLPLFFISGKFLVQDSWLCVTS